ncbi:FecR domain-containing protein [Luteimonas sp. RD2P54]|uniref:FecR domain-containing protein n=1 Tax=Luteimonas endophytica TaxID=3042023 RepID=A0ABT6J6X0_9GAMM|nr:FecR domain-containing protein [Luteimonas endophytica]MDH5822571.1 FecR domain-containing protein [Luteimonas endophytica]
MTEPGDHPARITQEAAHWHALQRQDRLSTAQQARFMDWLAASPEHLREYLAIARVAGELGDLLRAMPIDLEALIDDEAPRAAPGNVVVLPARRPPPPKTVPRRRMRLPRFAAAAVALLALGIGMHLAWPRSAHYAAPHGAPRSFELPDGTVVHLNAESALSMRFSLLHRRIELARGQASFVVADDRRPFAVHAAGLQVRDIGTTFDVSLQREQARIGVAEGRVRIVAAAGEGRLLADLRAGQSARVDYRDQAVSVSHEDVETMTGWWTRRVVFRDMPLRDVADAFNRLNRVHLHVEDAAAGELRLTGNLSGDDLESLRAFLDGQPTLRTTLSADRIGVGTRRRVPGGVQRK